MIANMAHVQLYCLCYLKRVRRKGHTLLSLGVFTLLKHVSFCCQNTSRRCPNSSTRLPVLSTQTSKHACLVWPIPCTSFTFVYTPAFRRSCCGSSGTFCCHLSSVGSRKFHRPLVLSRVRGSVAGLPPNQWRRQLGCSIKAQRGRQPSGGPRKAPTSKRPCCL